eukprot:4960210-Pyramimonas_sp.AAC.1
MRSQARPLSYTQLERILPTTRPINKNDRTAWNRNASNVGSLVFKERPGSRSAARPFVMNKSHKDRAQFRTTT